MKKHPILNKAATLLLVFAMMFCLLPTSVAQADTKKSVKTGVSLAIYASDVYVNWDGTSNVDQFVDADGNYCFAYEKGKNVIIVPTKNGKPTGKNITIKKKYSLFGGVTCDAEGNYYVVTGRKNTTDDTSKKTIFISKYDSTGKHIKTVGDNGSSSLAYYYDSSFYTQTPFHGGNCSIAVNGNLLTVNYARLMYSGHQSNSVFTINTDTMKKVDNGTMYNSHSFAQRTISYGDNFLYASEGDCYDRAFTISKGSTDGAATSDDIFHFWVKKDTLTNWDMFTLNNNFAHMGGIASTGSGSAALVATSAKSLSKKATTQNEQLFIQIFNPDGNMNKESNYVTTGKRSGKSGGNGDESVTDYGVKWLTSYGKNTTISNPQVVASGNNYIVLYELDKNGKYAGVYYMVVSSNGKILRKATCFSKTAELNPCRMPVYANGYVCWSGNKYTDSSNAIYTYRLKYK
jgi:hypothetical protein